MLVFKQNLRHSFKVDLSSLAASRSISPACTQQAQRAGHDSPLPKYYFIARLGKPASMLEVKNQRSCRWKRALLMPIWGRPVELRMFCGSSVWSKQMKKFVCIEIVAGSRGSPKRAGAFEQAQISGYPRRLSVACVGRGRGSKSFSTNCSGKNKNQHTKAGNELAWLPGVRRYGIDGTEEFRHRASIGLYARLGKSRERWRESVAGNLLPRSPKSQEKSSQD